MTNAPSQSPFRHFLQTTQAHNLEITHQLLWQYLLHSATAVWHLTGRELVSPTCQREIAGGTIDLEVYERGNKESRDEPRFGIEVKRWSYVTKKQFEKQSKFAHKRRMKIPDYQCYYLLFGTSQYEIAGLKTKNSIADVEFIDAYRAIQVLQSYRTDAQAIAAELQRAGEKDAPPVWSPRSLESFLSNYQNNLSEAQEWLETHWQEPGFPADKAYSSSYFMRNRAVQEAIDVESIQYRMSGTQFDLELSDRIDSTVNGTPGKLLLKLVIDKIQLFWHPSPPVSEGQGPQVRTLKLSIGEALKELDFRLTEGRSPNYAKVAEYTLPEPWNAAAISQHLMNTRRMLFQVTPSIINHH